MATKCDFCGKKIKIGLDERYLGLKIKLNPESNAAAHLVDRVMHEQCRGRVLKVVSQLVKKPGEYFSDKKMGRGAE